MVTPSRLPAGHRLPTVEQPQTPATVQALKTAQPEALKPKSDAAPAGDPSFTGLPASAVALATTPVELTRLVDGASKAARGSAANLTAMVARLTAPTLRVKYDATLVDKSKIAFGDKGPQRDLNFANASPLVLDGIGHATAELLRERLGIASVRDLVNASPDRIHSLARGDNPIAGPQLERLHELRGKLVAYEDATPTMDLASVSKVRARLEATQKTVTTMASLLDAHPVELSSSLVRLGATFQWLEAAQKKLADTSDAELAQRVKGSPTAVRAELGRIHQLLGAVLAKQDAFLEARTLSPEEATHHKAVEDASTALLTQPIASASPFAVKLLPNLSPKERIVEAEFTHAFQTKGHRMVREFLGNVRAGMYGPPNVIAPDDAKLLSPRYARADLFAGKSPTQLDDLDPDVKRKVQQSRAENNIPLHMTATVIARLALVQALDDLAKDTSIPPEKKTLLVTCGGVAAGKGYAVKKASDGVADLVKSASLVYDTDGETSGTFNEFVMKACKERGIHPMFLYVHADPAVAWERVFSRAAKEGRMVSEEPFLDSHVDSPRNFSAFHQTYKDDKTQTGAPAATFFIIDNASGTPQLVNEVPAGALAQDRDQLRHVIKQKTNSITEVPDFVVKTAKRGEKLWPERYSGA